MKSAVAILLISLLTVASGTGCQEQKQEPEKKREFAPKLTQQLLPTGFSGLMIGQATEKDVLAVFPKAKVSRDKRLGGTMIIGHNDLPGVSVRVGGYSSGKADNLEEAEAMLVVEDKSQGPILRSFSITRDPATQGSLCEWTEKTFDAIEAAKNCDHMYDRHKKDKDRMVYCIGTPDGKSGVAVRCRRKQQQGRTLEMLAYDKQSR